MKSEEKRLLRIIAIGGVLFVVWLIFGLLPKSKEYLEVFTPHSVGAIVLILAVVELFIAAMQREAFGQIITWILVILACSILSFSGWSVITVVCISVIAVAWIVMDGIARVKGKAKV